MDAITGAVKAMYEHCPYPAYGVPSFGSLNHDLEAVWHEIGGRTRPLDGLRVLDAGCGTGEKTVGCALLFPQVSLTGVELSGPSLAKARALARRSGCDVALLEGDIMDLPDLGGPSDIVVAMGVVMLLSDPVRGLRNLAAKLADDGLLSLYFYARRGRELLERFQRVVGLLAPDTSDLEDRLEVGRRLHADLKGTKAFGAFLSEQRYDQAQFEGVAPESVMARFFDQLLHVHERTYTLEGVLDLVAAAGLEVVDMLDADLWRLDAWLRSPEILDRAQRCSREERWALVEAIRPPFNEYRLVARKKGAPPTEEAAFLDPSDAVPAVRRTVAVDSPRPWHEDISRYETCSVRRLGRSDLRYHLGDNTIRLMRLCDGRRTVAEVARAFGDGAGTCIVDEAWAAIQDLCAKGLVCLSRRQRDGATGALGRG